MTFVVSGDQIHALIDALEQGDEITPDIRRWLIHALYDLSLHNAIDAAKHKRGHPGAASSWLAGRAAAALHETYGVSLGDAAKLARNKFAPDVTIDAIKLKCRQVRKGDTPMRFQPLDPCLIDELLDGLRRPIEKTQPGEIPTEAIKVQQLFLEKYGSRKKRNK